MSSKLKLFGSSLEQENLYLMNETFSGEFLAVELLEYVLNNFSCESIKDHIKIQIDEEIVHIDLYTKIIGSDKPLPSSGFEAKFVEYVKGPRSASEILFCIQAIFEALSLGVISWRLRNNSVDSSIVQTDRKIFREEYLHTRQPLKIIEEIVKIDGPIEISRFKHHTKEILSIFRETFSPENLNSKLNNYWNLNTSVESLSKQKGHKLFGWQNAQIVNKSYLHFVENYQKAFSNVTNQ